jgi:hypothetical protein
MDRENRLLRRQQARDSLEKKESRQKNVKPGVMKSYKARVESLENCVKTLQAVNDNHAVVIEQLKKMNNANEKKMKIQEKILLRARHLEVHVEHRSLGHPPLPDATLPELTFQEWCYFYNMRWCLNDYKAAFDIYDIENVYYERSALEGDYRIPSVDAFIRGETIPHPRLIHPPDFHYNDRFLLKVPKFYPPSPYPESHRRSRSRSPVRGEKGADAAVESSEDDDEYWIESARSQGDGSGPSSARE